uniref:DNA-directed RNA polymerases I and III subunit RPAC1 n=1 Tax=Steinernema glaseri TaxID=37863 RepID=A0A1I7ZRS7_9BILA
MPKASRRKGASENDQDNSSSLFMEQERVLNTYDNGTDFPSSFKVFKLSEFAKNLKIDIVSESEDGMVLEFDLIHVEAPIANALRRVLIAEVPTMALEKIYLYQNTSVIQDEVLCHRLGLLPVKADPRFFEWPDKRVVEVNAEGVDVDEEPAGEQEKNLIFSIDVTCKVNKSADPAATNPKDRFDNSHVYTNAFKWVPIGEQKETFSMDKPRMVNDDILVAKLRPGQQIEARCHCVKGVGRDHAKFSPVATATYRLLPTIKLKEKITGEAAERLQASFSQGVVDIVEQKGEKLKEKITGEAAERLQASFSQGVVDIVEQKGEKVAKVVDARRDTCSRNVLRHEDLAQKVELSRKKDHFIFSVESTGALKSSELVVEACKVMEAKALGLKQLIEEQLNIIEKME